MSCHDIDVIYWLPKNQCYVFNDIFIHSILLDVPLKYLCKIILYTSLVWDSRVNILLNIKHELLTFEFYVTLSK